VEAALKTALLVTGKPGVIAFEGGYHGAGYGSLNVTHRDHFRAPFQSQLAKFGRFLPFPEGKSGSSPNHLDILAGKLQKLLKTAQFGAILVEPIQARGGIRIPPPDLLPLLRKLCDAFEIPLILDEIYTGFGRTGAWFACEHDGAIPDIICLGKALTGGFPLSACVGKAALMDRAWPKSQGEAIHTSTFLGHPVGCAMALAQIRAIEKGGLVERSKALGEILARELAMLVTRTPAIRMRVSGRGLMGGLALTLPDGKPATQMALDATKAMLHRGYILLPEGADSNVISFTPPLTITPRQIKATVAALEEVLEGYVK
jgi:4-aminobutyrate aminotransferase-like enzyme